MEMMMGRGAAHWARHTVWIATMAAFLAVAPFETSRAETPPASSPPANSPDASQGQAPTTSEPSTPAPLPAPQRGAPESAPEVIEESARDYLDAAAFRAAFEGRTIHLTWNGAYYGSEQYLPGDRSIWTMRGGECQPGFWVYEREIVCFTYETSPTSCWRVFRSDGSVYAESVDGLLLKIVSVTDEPLNCAPDLLS